MYICRYSGWPAYTVNARNVRIYQQHFASRNRSGASATLLVSSLSDDLDRVTDRRDTVLQRSLFYATYSLTESPLEAREKILKTMIGFGVIYLRMMRLYEKHDNLEYAIQLGRVLNGHGYDVCMLPGGRDTITFIAYRVDISHRFSSQQPCSEERIPSDDALIRAD